MRLTPTQARILRRILKKDEDGVFSEPESKTAKRLGISVRSVRRTYRKAESFGLLKALPTPDGKPRAYRIVTREGMNRVIKEERWLAGKNVPASTEVHLNHNIPTEETRYLDLFRRYLDLLLQVIPDPGVSYTNSTPDKTPDKRSEGGHEIPQQKVYKKYENPYSQRGPYSKVDRPPQGQPMSRVPPFTEEWKRHLRPFTVRGCIVGNTFVDPKTGEKYYKTRDGNFHHVM